MGFAYFAAWWLLGTAFTLWLSRADRPLTWGKLLLALVGGLLGPITLVIIGIVILAQAQFWDKPVFPTKPR